VLAIPLRQNPLKFFSRPLNYTLRMLKPTDRMSQTEPVKTLGGPDMFAEITTMTEPEDFNDRAEGREFRNRSRLAALVGSSVVEPKRVRGLMATRALLTCLHLVRNPQITQIYTTRGAGDSVKPGVERSGTPGLLMQKSMQSPRSGRQRFQVAKLWTILNNVLDQHV
jgi:hypothetical protein